MLNGSLPEDDQEGSFELCERGACPEEQLVSTLLYLHFYGQAALFTVLLQAVALHNNSHDILHSDHNPKSPGPERRRKSRPKG